LQKALVRAYEGEELPKKKSWKERQRERRIRQQRAQEAYQVQREREAEKKRDSGQRAKYLGQSA